ncbi:MAG: VOC family protein [Acetobacteraceae bacterium]
MLTLDGQAFIALNGGPRFSFVPAVALFVRCGA